MRLRSHLLSAGGGTIMLLPAITLAACGALLGGGGTADLYEFGATEASQAAPSAAITTATSTIRVAFPGATFPPAIDNRILTVHGTRASYIANSRWVASAPELFDAALVRSFERNAPELSISHSNQIQLSDFVLLVDVWRFEAQYVGGEKAPPEILVNARVRLVRRSDRATIGEWSVGTNEAADANRVTSIVTAFDRATKTVTADVANHVRYAIRPDGRP